MAKQKGVGKIAGKTRSQPVVGKVDKGGAKNQKVVGVLQSGKTTTQKVVGNVGHNH